MRYRLAALLLSGVLPLMNVMAAPAPECSAILDIGQPPKGHTVEEHRKEAIRCLNNHLDCMLADPKVYKLPQIATLKNKDACSWLEKNLRITEEEGERRLRLTFLAGNREEQVYILNGLLRLYLRMAVEDRIQFHEKSLRILETCKRDLEKRIESERNPEKINSCKKDIDDLRSTRIPACRAEIARLKQIDVIKWAK